MRGSTLEIDLEGRKQALKLTEASDVVRITARTASRTAAVSTNGALQLLLLNRYVDLVDFGIDGRGRWFTETVPPSGGVSSEEVELHVKALAMAADRLEQVITGRDRY